MKRNKTKLNETKSDNIHKNKTKSPNQDTSDGDREKVLTQPHRTLVNVVLSQKAEGREGVAYRWGWGWGRVGVGVS